MAATGLVIMLVAGEIWVVALGMIRSGIVRRVVLSVARGVVSVFVRFCVVGVEVGGIVLVDGGWVVLCRLPKG